MSHLLIQLVHDGRAVWQIKEEVPREACRRMTDAELHELGHFAVETLIQLTKDGSSGVMDGAKKAKSRGK